VIGRDRRKIYRKPLPLLAYGAIMDLPSMIFVRKPVPTFRDHAWNDSKGGAA